MQRISHNIGKVSGGGDVISQTSKYERYLRLVFLSHDLYLARLPTIWPRSWFWTFGKEFGKWNKGCWLGRSAGWSGSSWCRRVLRGRCFRLLSSSNCWVWTRSSIPGNRSPPKRPAKWRRGCSDWGHLNGRRNDTGLQSYSKIDF